MEKKGDLLVPPSFRDSPLDNLRTRPDSMLLGERAKPKGTHAHIRVGGPSTEPIDVGEGDWVVFQFSTVSYQQPCQVSRWTMT